jgi:hypothetical protein
MSRIKKNEVLIDAIYKTLEGDSTIRGGDNVFNDHLPKVGEVQVTPEIIEGVNDYVCEFSASAVEATGKYSIEKFLANEKLNDVDASISMGAFGEVNMSFNRHKEVPVVGKDTTTHVYGGSNVKVAFVAGKNSGAMAKARDAVKTMGAEHLAKK